MSDASPKPTRRVLEKMVRRRAADHERAPMHVIVPENLTFAMETGIRRLLGRNAEVRAEPPSLVRFGDYCEAAEPNSVFGTFRLGEWSGTGLIVLQPRLVDLAVETLLGGGQAARPESESRDLTTVDRAMAGRFMRICVDEIARVLSHAERDVGALAAKLVRVETDPRLLTVARRQDMVVKASFEILSGQGQGGPLDLILPESILEPTRRKLRHLKSAAAGQDAAERAAPALLDVMPDAPLTLHAVLDRLMLSLSDIAAWQEGDVIPLGVGAEPPVTLYGQNEAGPGLGRQMFVGRLGASRGRKAVRVLAAKPAALDISGAEVLP